MSTRGRSVHPPQVELGVRGVTSDRPAVDGDTAVGVGVAEHADVGAPEGLGPEGRRLGDLAGGLDLVVEDDEHAEAPRLGAAATRSALTRFMPASELSPLAGRWAPTTTTVDRGTARFRKYAVSSSVAVPWVMTTPASGASRVAGADRLGEAQPVRRADERAADRPVRHRDERRDSDHLRVAARRSAGRPSSRRPCTPRRRGCPARSTRSSRPVPIRATRGFGCSRSCDPLGTALKSLNGMSPMSEHPTKSGGGVGGRQTELEPPASGRMFWPGGGAAEHENMVLVPTLPGPLVKSARTPAVGEMTTSPPKDLRKLVPPWPPGPP